MELLYRALLDVSELFSGLDRIEARFKNVNITTLDLKIRGLQEADAGIKRLREELGALNTAGAGLNTPRVRPAPPLVPDTAIQAQINAQIAGLSEVGNTAKASASVFRSAQEEEKFAALQNRDAIREVQLALTRTRTEFDKQHGQAATWQAERDAVIAYQQAINGVTASIQQLNTRQDLTLTQARTLSSLEGQIARQQASLEGRVNPLGLSGNVANAIRAAGLSGAAPLPAGGSLGAAAAPSVASATAADSALAHLKVTLDAGRISAEQYRAALLGLDSALKADIGATEVEIKLLTELNALDAAQSARLTELIAQQRAYAGSIISTSAALQAQAAAARQASVAGQLQRGLGAGGLNGAALGLSFASPALGLAATALSFGPQTVAIAGVGLAVAGTAKFFIDGANKAALFNQQLNQINSLSHVGTAAINDYGKYVRKIGEDLGISTDHLNEFGRQAVLVGLDSGPGLKTFTKGMSELSIILRDVNGATPGLEEVGTEVVKVLRSMGQSSEDVNNNFGATINSLVALKTQFGVAIPDVTALATYFSSYASTIGLTTDQILAFSASLVSVGARAQGSGSQLTKFFEKAAAAGASGGAPLKAFAFALGLSADATQQLLRTDPARFLQTFAERLGTLHKQGIDSSIILKSLGLDTNQAARAFNELSVASINTQKALDIAKKGLEDTGLSARTAADAVKSYPDDLKKLGVAFDNLKIDAGQSLLPFLTNFVQGLTRTVSGITELVNDGTKLRSFFADLIGYVGPAIAVIGVFKAEMLAAKLSLFIASPQAIFLLFGSIVTGSEAATAAAKAFVLSNPFGIIATLVGGLAVVSEKIIGETNRVRDQTDAADAAAGEALQRQVSDLRKKGDEVSKVRAQILLASQQLADAQQGAFIGTDLLGNRSYKVDPAEITRATTHLKELKEQLVQVNTEHLRHASVAVLAGNLAKKAAQETSAAYGTLSDKLVALNGTYTEVKTTAFESQLNSARKTLEAFNKEVAHALDLGEKGKSGGITAEEAKTLRNRAAAVAARDVSDIVQQQHTKDLDTAASNEQAIQSARLAVIKDARTKREGEYQNEADRLRETYGKAIQEALTNAKAPGLDPANRAALQRDAGVLQGQLSDAIKAAAVKRDQDLAQIDDDRAKKVRDAGVQGLANLASESDGRTKILQGEHDRAVELAGSDVDARLAAEQRYGPALEKQQEVARGLQYRADHARLDTQLQDALKAAENQGSATAGLQLAAQQDYQSKSRQLDSAYVADIQKFRLDADKTTNAARLAVFQEGLDKELAGIKDLEGKKLALEEASLKARRASAVAAGDTGQMSALDKGIKLLEGVKSDNLKAFREELKKSAVSATDLRVQLDNIASGPLEKALKGAAAPFNSILKTARDNVASLNKSFDSLTKDQQNSGQGAALRSQLAEQNRIILASNQGRNQALLTAQQDYDRMLADQSTDANSKLAKTEFDGGKITETVYDRQLDAARRYWSSRLKVAEKGSADEQAASQKLADLQTERERARTVTQAKQADVRSLTREELNSQLALAKTEAERVRVRAQLTSGDAARLAAVDRELASLKASKGSTEEIAKLERERLTLRGSLNTAAEEGRQREADTLAFNREQLAGQLAIAKTEDDRSKARGSLLAFDQGTLATLQSRLAAETALGAPVEKIRKLKTDILAVETGIKTQQDEQLQRTQALLASQLSLNASEVSRQTAMARSNAEMQASKGAAVGQAGSELSDVSRRIAEAQAQGKAQADINALLTEYAGKETALYQAQRDAARYGLEVSQQQLDLDEARQKAQLQLTGMADDAVASAQLDLDVTQRQLAAINDQLSKAEERKLTEAEINALQVKRLALIGQEAEQGRKLLEAEREKRNLIEAVQTGGGTLARAAGIQGTPIENALQNVTDTRTRLATATRAYSEAQADLNREQSTANLQKFQAAQAGLTTEIGNQRKALTDLAAAYRTEISAMDGVRDATEKLRAVVPGATAPDGKIKQGDEGQEYERLYAIQKRRDQAVQTLKAAIRSGNSEDIQNATNDLTAQQDRYNKQADLLKKNGLQFTPSDDRELNTVLKQLDKLGINFDREAVNLRRRAAAATLESKAAITFSDAADRLPKILQNGADAIARAINNSFSSSASLLPSVSAVQAPTASQTINQTRGGDTINISIPITLNGQPMPTPDEFRRIAQGEIASAIQGARRDKAWSARDC